MLIDPRDLMWMAAEAGITERERQIFALRHCDGLSDAAIAAQLGITEETVRSTCSHVREAFVAHQWPKAAEREAQENLQALDQPEASEEMQDYAEGVLEAHENRRAGRGSDVSRWPEKTEKRGQFSQKKNERQPPPPKVRMVSVNDVLILIREREHRM